MNAEAQTPQGTRDRLIASISPWVEPLGYEIVHLEVQTHRGAVLRIFIDRLLESSTAESANEGIGVEDCAKVARALDEPLDQLPELEAIFHGSYELEVSSPGVDRPLRKETDYERFSGREVRIHVYRPLTAEEIENSGYLTKNPKQKHFLGTLKGLKNGKVLLALGRDNGALDKKKKPKGKKASASSTTNSAEEVMIPLPLISKANLEPDFSVLDERE